jgi:putative transport protein
MDFFVQALRNNPELVIFLTLAIGFLIGRIKFGSFSLGIVVGTLFAGVLIGQLDIKVPAIVKAIFFDLFLFKTGGIRTFSLRPQGSVRLNAGCFTYYVHSIP